MIKCLITNVFLFFLKIDILLNISKKHKMKTFIETSSILLKGIDEIINGDYFNDRTEAVNQAIKEMLDRYKLGKLRVKEQQIGSKEGK